MSDDAVCLVELPTHPSAGALESALMRAGNCRIRTVKSVPSSDDDYTVLILNNLPVHTPLPEEQILESVARGKGLLCIHDVVFPLGPNRQLTEALGIRPAFDAIQSGREGEMVYQDVMLARADPANVSERFLIRPVNGIRRHPILAGVGEFELADEVWAQNLAPGVQVLLNVEVGDRVPCHSRFRQPVPICGCRKIGKGRVVFFSLGHFSQTYCQSEVVQVFSNALAWLSRQTQDEEYVFDLFLSFASADEREAQELVRNGIESGLNVFMAKRSIQPGDLWDRRIREALVASREVAVLVTPASMRSDWVAIEWGAAWALDKRVTPIMLGVDADHLPDHLRRNQAVVYSQLDYFLAGVQRRSKDMETDSNVRGAG